MSTLYRLFNEQSELLYVGVSDAPEKRLKQHRQTKQWADEIASVTHQPFPERKTAEHFERVAVMTEFPKYNGNLWSIPAAAGTMPLHEAYPKTGAITGRTRTRIFGEAAERVRNLAKKTGLSIQVIGLMMIEAGLPTIERRFR